LSLNQTEEERVKSFVGIIQGVVAVVLGAITLWVGTEVSTLGKTMVELNARVTGVASKQEDLDRIWQLQLRQAQSAAEARVTRVEQEIRESSITADAIAKMAKAVGSIEGDQRRTRESIQKLWNLGRANNANVKALMRKVDPTFSLVEPNLIPEENR
jgi:hypothetical protein